MIPDAERPSQAADVAPYLAAAFAGAALLGYVTEVESESELLLLLAASGAVAVVLERWALPALRRGRGGTRR